MWQVMGSCERLPAQTKADLGGELVRLAEKGKASDQEIWALSRLGARALLSGPANCVVRPETAAAWIEKLLRGEWRKPETLAFAVVQMARCTGDRTRDLDEELRQKVAERLAPLPTGQRWSRQVLEVVVLEEKEQARILDESLPAGLQIRTVSE